MDSPSIFGSATKRSASSGGRPRKRRMRAPNSAKSASEKALSSDSIGTRCANAEKPSARSAPMRRLGLSSRIRCGKRASMARLRRTSASYSASEISGASWPW